VSDLLPCPFCGSSQFLEIIDASYNNHTPDCDCAERMRGLSCAVTCNFKIGGCGASGGYENQVADAKARWNIRAGHQTPEHKHVWCRNVGEAHYHCTGEGCNAIKPYGKPCTCYRSPHGCSVDLGHLLGELWFCQKHWDALLKERAPAKSIPAQPAEES
jgi:hypothetical protein